MAAADPEETIDDFLGLVPTEDPRRWQLKVTEGLRSSSGTLFGGGVLAAGIAAMEHVTARPCVWATTQYISYARLNTVVDIDVDIAAAGNTVTQARAVASAGAEPIATVHAALGARTFDRSGQWITPLDVREPDDCPPRTLTGSIKGAIHERVELRIAAGDQFADLDGSPGTGRSALWARLPAGRRPSAAGLAVLG